MTIAIAVAVAFLIGLALGEVLSDWRGARRNHSAKKRGRTHA